MWKVQLFKLNYDEKEKEAVNAVVDSGWLTMGEKINEFESKFAEYMGGGDVQCCAVSNGTAALHLALMTLGIGEGDEVIIPALTFVADANVVVLVGAKPVLADCASDSNWNISAETIEKCITERTKAVIVVHYAGYPCDMDNIVELCAKRNIRIIEDVAHAPGASISGRMCGTWGDVGCFSFFSNKNLSVGEGGMVVSSSSDIINKVRLMRSHGMTSLTLDRYKGRAISYDVVMPGLNYRMDEVRAALGIVQLEKLDGGNARRKHITELYRSKLMGSDCRIPFPNVGVHVKPAYHILPVLLPENSDRVKIIEKLKEYGVQSSIHYPPFWAFKAYSGQYDRSNAPNAGLICERELTLPLYPTMSDSEVDYVCSSLMKAI